MQDSAQNAKRQSVMDQIGYLSAIPKVFEMMLVMPEGIRPYSLFIDKEVRTLQPGDLRNPG